ncbi:hypothetical protein [Symbiopectobacterium purcellii]|uniref:hypothetical protein n=1 Tax=Symbiopectobacterium purcellii TaxID=2871826 RepID=UPI003F87F5F0
MSLGNFSVQLFIILAQSTDLARNRNDLSRWHHGRLTPRTSALLRLLHDDGNANDFVTTGQGQNTIATNA